MSQSQLIQRAAVCGILLTGVTLGGCTKEGGAIGGAIGGAVLGGVIGHQIDDDNGALVGALLGAAIGGGAGYFIGKEIEERREADEYEKRQAEERYRDFRDTLPEEQLEQLEESGGDNNTRVAQKVEENTYILVDPATGEAEDTAYVFSDEGLADIQSAQRQGQVPKLDEYQVVFAPDDTLPTS
ncbi:MAG: glycine zipper domain-containing protein [Planctomycetota bacterium]